MPLYVLKDIHLEIEGAELFSLDKLTIEEGDVIGLIGKNGAGKTCLLRILSGELTDFSGSISGKASTCFGELTLTEDDLKSGDKLAIKGANGTGKTTFLNYLYTSLPTAYKVGYFRQSHLDFLDSSDTVLAAVSEKAEGRLNESQLRTLLALLDFKREKVFRKIKDLSRGEWVKISFLALLVSDLDVLLLDEITNFLDMKTIEACEKVLTTFSGILVFVSHDYYFIEHVANRVLDIKTWQQENDT